MKSKGNASRFAVCLLAVALASPLVAYGQTSSAGPGNVRASLKRANAGARRTRRLINLRLYFVNPKHPSWENNCGGGEFVNRKIPATRRLADAALRLLFAGPNAEEQAKGMIGLAPLGDYYLGVTIKGRTAILNFSAAGEDHIHGTACELEQMATPIEKTLRQFRTIRWIQFAIDGKIIEEWDA